MLADVAVVYFFKDFSIIMAGACAGAVTKQPR